MTADLFTGELASLVGRHAQAARHDPEALGNMIERLSASLGMTIALAAQGDPALIDKLITGCEAHIHAEAVDKARVIRAMNQMRREG